MKARADAEARIGCGLCAETCASVFKMNDENVAEVIANPVPAGADGSCREAAENCPVEAITAEE